MSFERSSGLKSQGSQNEIADLSDQGLPVTKTSNNAAQVLHSAYSSGLHNENYETSDDLNYSDGLNEKRTVKPLPNKSNHNSENPEENFESPHVAVDVEKPEVSPAEIAAVSDYVSDLIAAVASQQSMPLVGVGSTIACHELCYSVITDKKKDPQMILKNVT